MGAEDGGGPRGHARGRPATSRTTTSASRIPYTLNGEEQNYIPDFLVCLDDGRGANDLLNLIVEVTGEKKKEKAAKVATARTLWVPAVNNHGGFGRWAFLEVSDPWDAQNTIRGFLNQAQAESPREFAHG